VEYFIGFGDVISIAQLPFWVKEFADEYYITPQD
jgi:hypothetical protein